jgi:hypothetical protein
MFRRYVMTTVALALLAGCATQTNYQPAEKRGADGYTETKLTANRYRVTFVGNSATPSETVKDYALLRAAELTLQEGYDWFQIAHLDGDKKTNSTYFDGGTAFPAQTSVYQRCGLMSCDTYVASSPGFGGGIGTVSHNTAYSSALEIVMGKRPMPKTADSYDARELASTLRRTMAKAP